MRNLVFGFFLANMANPFVRAALGRADMDARNGVGGGAASPLVAPMMAPNQWCTKR